MLKKISLSIVTLLLLATLLTSCFPLFGSSSLGNVPITSDGTKTSQLISSIIKSYSYYDYELTDEQLSKAIVAGYKEITGDRYAQYYTAEEFEAFNAAAVGENQGIGIIVTENKEYSCIEINSVVPDSPADKAGLRDNDLIVQIGIGESAKKVSEITYDAALAMLQGKAGTKCEIGIVRDGNFNEVKEFSVLREKYTSPSILYEVCEADPTVGIVKILNFDIPVPEQFKEAMTKLIGKGCTKFVYDLRNNPGGDLAAVSAILSYFLNKDDVIVITTDINGNEKSNICEAVSHSGRYEPCSVSESEIGMYRKYPAAVLINGNSASAAELFTGTFKSYGIGTIVGEKSYGKGSMQSIYDLSKFDSSLKGGIKITTKLYRPYNMENYNGIGIDPTEGYSAELTEEASKLNDYKIIRKENQKLDNQLALAVSALNK